MEWLMPKHFRPEEFIPKSLFNKYGTDALRFLDTNVLLIAHVLREQFGTTIINNWHDDGDRNWCGLRTPWSEYYSQGSAHSWGKAIDCIFPDYQANDVRKWLRHNYTEYAQKTHMYIPITVEEGPDIDWLHISVQNNENLFNEFYVATKKENEL